MTFRNGFPVCNHCGREIKRLTFEEQMNDIMGHGWSDWHTARIHSCYQCYNEHWNPPCGECRTHRCEKGMECWWHPPLRLFPYETYFAEVNLEELLEACFSTWFFTFKHDPERFAVVMSIASQQLRTVSDPRPSRADEPREAKSETPIPASSGREKGEKEK